MTFEVFPFFPFGGLCLGLALIKLVYQPLFCQRSCCAETNFGVEVTTPLVAKPRQEAVPSPLARTISAANEQGTT